MATFTNAITIERRIEDVFEFLADFENVPRWNYAIVETRKTSDGPVGVGTTYRQVRSVPSRAEETFEVTAYHPVDRVEIRGQLGHFPARLSYALSPVGDREVTVVTNEVELEPTGAARLVGMVAMPRVRAAVAANLGELKKLLEHPGSRPD